MNRLPLVITLRLDEATLASIRQRIGDGSRVKSLSQFVREGIRLRLEEAGRLHRLAGVAEGEPVVTRGDQTAGRSSET